MADICDWPPGFRFHPTDEELILYYLKRKISHRKIKLDIIADVDVYKFEPQELPGTLTFFNGPRDRKYPNGLRANRATREGYWKATGKDRIITCNSRNVGIKKTLVFYRGRAPTGQRTDWVMHEYILEEEELNRCEPFHDYYVIYKLFKKSGPGPKNGEQYGAPFKEEEWAEDDCPKSTSSFDQFERAQQGVNVPLVDTCSNAQVDHIVNYVDELLNGVSNEPTPEVETFAEFEQALSEFLGPEECQSTVTNPSFEEPNRLVLEGDFIEMDDLIGPEPAQGFSSMLPQMISNIDQDSQLVDDGLSEFDLYNDPKSILYGLAPNDQRVFPTDSHRSQKSESLNQCDFEVLSYPTFQEVVSVDLVDFGGQSYTRRQEGGSLEQVDFGMHSYVGSHEGVQSYSDATSCVVGEMWNIEANCLVNSTETEKGLMPLPSTGVLNGGISTSISSETNQNQEVERSEPWSSTLWSFVDSIPAAPASAADSALLTKAFQRMSSIGRVRINSRNSTLSSVGSVNIKPSSSGLGGRVKGYFFFSILAALFAVVYVFIGGSNANVFGKLHCSMNL